jgi:hypothetical protein
LVRVLFFVRVEEFRRAFASELESRFGEVVPASSDIVLGRLAAKYGPPVEREAVPCDDSYNYDYPREQSSATWIWREHGGVRATLALEETCEDATLTYSAADGA